MKPASSLAIRNAARWIHLGGAAWLGTFVYSPLGSSNPFRLATQVVVIPLLTMTGLLLWKQAQLRNLLGPLIGRPRESRSATGS